MGTAKTVVVLGGGVVGGYYFFRWLFTNEGPGDGSLFGFGGGQPGGTKFKGAPESGPLDVDGGDGGTGEEPGEGKDKTGTGKDPGNPGDAKGGESNSGGKNNDGGKSQSGGGTGGAKDGDSEGDGSGGTGGGSGGGIGDGVGEGDGDVLGQWDEHGHGKTEEGGGDGGDGSWGGLMIEGELAPPDLSDAKIESMRDQIYTLVWETVFSTELAPPLHAYDSLKGSPRKWWADVVLYTHYPSLPYGRLDKAIKSHHVWIGLWVDIHHVVKQAETELMQHSYS